MSFFIRHTSLTSLANIARFVRRPTKATGKSRNKHRSNKAKEGLYHGTDVRFGHSISHSFAHSKRRWYPNVLNKRVWSDSLNDWIRFKMTAKALKAIDTVGGIDNYLLALDEYSVRDSNYITKMRSIVATALYSKGLLHEKYIRKLGYHKNPPMTYVDVDAKS